MSDYRREQAWQAGHKAAIAGKPETKNNRQPGTVFHDDMGDLIERLRTTKFLSLRNQFALQVEAADELTALRERVAALSEYLGIAIEDFDSNFGRCSNEAHWSNEARAILARPQPSNLQERPA